MSEEHAQARKIGIFTLVALILFIVGVVAFGSGKLFKSAFRVEMVFTGDVTGLSVGSSVSFRGVIIGEVENIEIENDLSSDDMYVRVIAKVLQEKQDETLFESDDHTEVVNALIEQGIAAKLVTQSVLTGRLQVKFEFYPDQEKHLDQSRYGHPVIPTVQQDIEMFGRFLSQVADEMKGFDFATFTRDLQMTIYGVNKLVNSEDLAQTLSNASSITGHIDEVVADANGGKYSLSEEVEDTLKSVQRLMDSVTKVSDSAKPILVDARKSMDSLNQGLNQFSDTLKTYQGMVEPGSEISQSIQDTLAAIERSANQLRQLAETLQRNPEAILSGKQN